jgi:quercetin dioxygenase-like cupin family protein
MNLKSRSIVLLAAATSVATVLVASQASAQPASPSAPSAILSRTTLDDLNVWVKWGKLHSTINTAQDSQSEVVFQRAVAPPGVTAGWHTHAGVVFVSVAEGVLTYYDQNNPCEGRTFSQGQGFVEEAHGDVVHIARNEGSTDLVLYLMYAVNKGDDLRTTQPAPAGACF